MMQVSSILCILFLLTLVLVLTSCDPMAVTSERDNVLDPANEAFIPAAPTNIRVVPEDGHVRISWTRNTDHAEGYLIEKSINSSDNFTELATVGPEESRYIDTSNRFGVPTLYRVTSFIVRDGVPRSHLTRAAGLTTNATFVVQPYVISGDGTAIELIWRHFYTLHHGYIIEKRINGAPGWSFHDNFRHVVSADNFYSYAYPLDGTEETIQFRVSPYFDDDEGGYVIIVSVVFPETELP